MMRTLESNDARCPEKRTLVEFLLGKLPESEIQFVEHHLASCPPCGDTLRMLDTGDTMDDLARQAMVEISGIQPASVAEQTRIEAVIRQLQSCLPGGEPVAGPAVQDVAERAREVTLLLDESDNPNHLGRLAQYEITELLGAGGTGVVYKAVDQQLQRTVALKILRPSLGSLARQRFLSEAQAAARIDHQQVTTIYQVGEAGSLAWMAMQWLPGETLEQRLQHEPTLTDQTARDICRQIAMGLDGAHEEGLIHRDIKPANIWIESGSGGIKILDFGLARVADDDPQFTDTGMIAGTPTFMSPEQARGASIDRRSDLFSLGCVLYRMTTGELPFQAPNVLATLQSIQRFSPSPPHELNPEISRSLSDLTLSLLEKNPQRRPHDAQAVLHALDHDQADWRFPVPQPVESKMALAAESGGTRRRSGPFWLIAAGLLVLLVSGALMYGPQIIRIATGKGQIVIKSTDDNVQIEVLHDGRQVRLVDAITGNSFDIREGTYEFRGVGEGNSVVIQPNKLVLSRGGQEIVHVSVVPGPIATEPETAAFGATPPETAAPRATVPDVLLPGGRLQFPEDIALLRANIENKMYEAAEAHNKLGVGHPKIKSLESQVRELLRLWKTRSPETMAALALHGDYPVYFEYSQDPGSVTTETKATYDQIQSLLAEDELPDYFMYATEAALLESRREHAIDTNQTLIRRSLERRLVEVYPAAIDSLEVLRNDPRWRRGLPRIQDIESAPLQQRFDFLVQQLRGGGFGPAVNPTLPPVLTQPETGNEEPVYDGQPLSYWIDVAGRERNDAKLVQITQALAGLANESTSAKTLEALRKIFKKSDSYELYDNDVLGRLLGRVSPDHVLDLVVDEIVTGNDSSRSGVHGIFSQARNNLSLQNELFATDNLNRIIEALESVEPAEPDVSFQNPMVNLCSIMLDTHADYSLGHRLDASSRSRIVHVMQQHDPLATSNLGAVDALVQNAPEMDGLAHWLANQIRNPSLFPMANQEWVQRIRDLGPHAKPAVPVLADLLREDSDWSQRENTEEVLQIVQLLGDLGPAAAEAIPVLERAREVYPGRVADACDEALRKIGR